MKPEWVGRAKFAEYAEALDVETSEIMSAMETGRGGASVLYSPGIGEQEPFDPETPVLRAALRRDRQRVLRVVQTEQMGTIGEFMAKVEELHGG